ncbi:hypothetical protein JG687_00012851 [Phytophthora cactorum]|uniref:Uncharacterized protein n=1 Tax=Phytophthora cactorum TaxID=29920 RepID=A0A8T1U0N2_9STRA|nr:hypothetical protein GQ600_19645 [Phytophthora cactorum]KAG6952671.1 hypothetical protein JG687_00012851 [Phytophthora cactorum]
MDRLSGRKSNAIPHQWLLSRILTRWTDGTVSKTNVSDTEEAINWAANTANKRIAVPVELSDGVSDGVAEREQKIKRLMLRGGRFTTFGSLPYLSLLTLRGTEWADDSCMRHLLALLQREHQNVRVVDPIFHNLAEREDKLRVIASGGPFSASNELVLLALHVKY